MAPSYAIRFFVFPPLCRGFFKKERRYFNNHAPKRDSLIASPNIATWLPYTMLLRRLLPTEIFAAFIQLER
jgi:hypothetical protein